MNELLLKRCAALLLLLIMLLPIGLGLIHAIESHRDVACHSESESHIHDGRSDCGHLHLMAPSAPWKAVTDIDPPNTLWPALRSAWEDQIKSAQWPIHSDNRRGPPAFMF